VELGKAYIKFIYSGFVLDEERVIEVKNNEDAFFMYLLKSDYYREKDLANYIRYLNKALSVYDEMSRGIEMLLKEIEDKLENKNSNENTELENLKKILKEI